DCEIMLYSSVENDSAMIHLGIKKDEDSGFYMPKTFFVEKVSEKKDDIYLAKQEEIATVVCGRILV
ncbi:MAG: hypothetical protein NC416_14000, partial [Eubacterium sp.]|nr:hypothetical protein [Eubacterium sp.]